jgi:hypothetical protein
MPGVKPLRLALGIVVVVGLVFGLGRLFVGQLTAGGSPPPGPAGIVLSPPPGFTVEQRGELDRARAARELAQLLARRPAEPRLGLHFTATGGELFWLVDRGAGGEAALTELAAAPSGTRIETIWRGTRRDLARRLDWAAVHGNLEVPDLPRGESRNLYH